MANGIALTIGLNRVDPGHYQDWQGPLIAAEADAKDMAQIAKSQDFEVQTLLTQKAKHDAVLASISKAASALSKGDIFLLTYSGHGGQLPDDNSDEFDDGQDETWCLYDKQLVDDQLYHALGEFKAGVRIVVVSDSCHSGSVVKLLRSSPDIALRMEECGTMLRCMSPMVAFRTYDHNRKRYDSILQNKKLRNSWQTINASVLLISACQDSQTALDGTFNGLFTGTLLRIWNRGAFRGGYRVLFDAIAQRSPFDHMPNYYKTGQLLDGIDAMRPFTI